MGHHIPDSMHVYHGRPLGIPQLVAFCDHDLPDHDYFPHALDDDIVRAWALKTRYDITLHLLPDPDNDSDDARGAAAGPFATVEEAYDYCTERFGTLRLVWL